MQSEKQNTPQKKNPPATKPRAEEKNGRKSVRDGLPFGFPHG